ncbi:hypothetical protein GCM10010394_67750 [Streptomyces crystallinus]|uniref:Secreted protein n=1 Tax=Streptomyces crystallinus TaxID=68191 RepID=A0ABP3S6C0_9ACTN
MAGLLLSGCSSGSDDPGPPGDTSQTDAPTTPPPQEPTGQPSEGTSGQQTNGGEDGGGSGGFKTAGRVSTDFDGVWPSVRVTFTNTADDPYDGTATVSDCSPTGRWTTTTGPQPVKLSHNESVTLEWVFENTSDEPLIPVHTACVTLNGDPKPRSSPFPAETVPPDPEEEPSEPGPSDSLDAT